MRALLVNPWIYDFAAYDLWSKPLGLLTIASHLKRLNVDVGFVDCLDRFHPRLMQFLKGRLPASTVYGSGPYYSETIEKPALFKSIPRYYKRYGFPVDLFVDILKEEPAPDIILVTSGMTYWYPGVFEAIAILRERFGSIPILLGGIYAQLCFDHASAFSGADVVCGGSNVRENLRLIGKWAKKEIDNACVAEEAALAGGFDLYPELPYVTLRTSHGCPFRCSYCGWYLLGQEFRQIAPDVVVDRIEYFAKERGVKNFSFYDDALLYNAETHIGKILEKVLARKMNVHFHTPNGLHSRFLTPELARLLKRAGFVNPRLGLETSSSRRQSETGGKTSNEDFKKAIEYLKDAGYEAGDIAVYILMGLPGQDFEEVEESVRFVTETHARLFLEEYSPIPQTADYLKSGLPADADPLWHNNSAFPLYRPDDYRKFQELKDLAHALKKAFPAVA